MTDIVIRLDPEIFIGSDTINRAGTICNAIGNRALIATEQALYESRKIERIIAVLSDAGVESIVFDEIPAHATADVAEAAAELALGARCSTVIAFGGLKTQAIARTVAIIANSKFDLFELIDGRKPPDNFIPLIAIPTTGRDPFLFADYFLNVDPRDRSVKQIKSPPGLCRAALIDSSLFESLSEKYAATTAFDGFCTALEAYCSTRSHFLSDSLLEQAMAIYTQMMDSYAETQTTYDLAGGATKAGFLMAMGTAFSAPGIGTALAYALSGKFPVEKSRCSTALLPYILERLVASRPEKIARIAALTGEPVAGASVAECAAMTVEGIRRRMGQLQVPARLKDFDLSLDRLAPVAEAARNLEFVIYSPWTVASEDAYDLLKQAY